MGSRVAVLLSMRSRLQEAAARARDTVAGRPVGRWARWGGGALAALLVAWVAWRLTHRPVDDAFTTVTRRGDLALAVSTSGTLRPAGSIGYRSPVAGREAEIVFLAPEGELVSEGDLIARLDTTELQADLARTVQEERQTQLELQVAQGEYEEAVANLDSLKEGEASLGLEETRAALRRSEKKVARLREEYEGLKPLLQKGFVTRDEIERAEAELEEAEAELQLAQRKSQVQTERTRPREEQKAQLLLRQKAAQVQNARARLAETASRVQTLRATIEGCSIYARAPGLVVYEESMSATPRRKVRVGDRVTASQGLVTIPEVQRMVVEGSVAESEVHHLRPGQPAEVTLDAFPGLTLSGRVSRVGTLARTSIERPGEPKHFDLIVELDPTSAELRPEMTARATINVGTLGGVLLLPVNAVFEQQGRYVCHVVRTFGVESREVTLGESNGEFVVVRAGLREGERVSLSDVAGGPARPVAAPSGAPSAGAPATKGGGDVGRIIAPQ